jgi:hypothetical protein
MFLPQPRCPRSIPELGVAALDVFGASRLGGSEPGIEGLGRRSARRACGRSGRSY